MTALLAPQRFLDPLFEAYFAHLPVLLEERPQGVVVLSASQVERFVLCKRWWALEYLYKIKGDQKAAAILGDAIHKHLEDWMRFAKPIPGTSRAGRIARRMMQHLPVPGIGVAERKFYFRTRWGHFYSGRMDWSGLLFDWAQTLVVTGIDHKSTSSYSDYGKTAEMLHTDIQAIIYSIALFVGFEASLVELFWNYGETKKDSENPQTVPVKTRVQLPVVYEKFDKVIEPIAAEIVLLHQQRPHPLHLPPTYSACDAYGGCPHRDYCNISEEERLTALMASPPDPNSLAARMAAAGQFPPGYNGGPPQFAQPPQQQAPQSYPQQSYGQPPQGQPPQGYGQTQPQFLQQPGTQQPLPFPQQPPQFIGGGTQVLQGPPQQGYGQAPPQFAPPGQQPPQPPPQQHAHYQQPPPGPLPPEAGTQLPPETEEAGGKKKRAGGRPPGAKNKELGVEDTIYLAGVQAMISNPTWDGSTGRLQQAGTAALEVMRARL